MLENAYVCPYCMTDLKGNPIESTAKSYYDNAEYFTKAIELINKGWECPECGCRWTYEGRIIKDGIEELKDKYKQEKDINAENSENTNDDNEANTKTKEE